MLDALSGDVGSSVANYCRSLACERPYEVSKVRPAVSVLPVPADGAEAGSTGSMGPVLRLCNWRAAVVHEVAWGMLP